MKQKVRNVAIIVTVVGLLALALGASGCIETKMTATWLSTGAARNNPGGLTVSGQLSAQNPIDTTKYVPLPNAILTLDGSNDADTWINIASTTTTLTGTYTFPALSSTADTYLLYRVNFDGQTPTPLPNNGPYQAQSTVVAWYKGINYGLDYIAQDLNKVPAGTFPDHGTGVLTQLNNVKTMANKPSQYKSAAAVMDQVLVKMDKANATAGGTNQPLLYADYWTYLLAKDFHWLSGEAWQWPTRAMPDGFPNG